MSQEPQEPIDDKFRAKPGRLPTHQPPDGVFHAAFPEEQAAEAAKAEQVDDEGRPVRQKRGMLPVRIAGIPYQNE